MRIGLINDLPFTIHVTMVTFSELAVSFILSDTQVPVPTGTIRSKFWLKPHEAVEFDDMPDGIQRRFLPHGIGRDLRIAYEYGRDEDGRMLAVYNIHDRPADDFEIEIDWDTCAEDDDDDEGDR